MSRIGANLLEADELQASDLAPFSTLRSVSTPQDRRTSVRRSIEVRATITVPDESALLEVHTVDLSVGGASITLPFEVAQGQACLIELEFAAFGSSNTFRIPAEVRYCVTMESTRFRVGVRFGRIDDATAAFIAAVMNA